MKLGTSPEPGKGRGVPDSVTLSCWDPLIRRPWDPEPQRQWVQRQGNGRAGARRVPGRESRAGGGCARAGGRKPWASVSAPVKCAGRRPMSCGATHPVVLIGGHGCELGLCEDEGLEVLLGVALAVLARVHEDHVEPGLVAVHGVEDDLRGAQGWGTAGRSHRGRSPPAWAGTALACCPPVLCPRRRL